MLRLHILVEGQTEETIANNLLRPHLETLGWQTSISLLTTRRLASGVKYRGGLSHWKKIERELALLLRARFDVLTTLIDYYGLPDDAPGMADRPTADPYARVRHVERAIRDSIGHPAFRPHLVLHEVEAWVFAAADQLGQLTDDPALVTDLRRIAHRAGGPELIDDGRDTAPSKRLARRMPAYQKTLHGPLAIEALGLDRLRAACPHLDAWLVELDRARAAED